uniref:ARID domain-containing protein n=1 Tax=Wuchereria bancrofti TaxID=6293 RepID=A0A1I8F0L9_WUCBA
MHRIGKPVTRIPIMAKQVLDLYELYRLVVQHGGLVEIINKKLWREITRGLNLPSSITSAAFTLRTQYQKYLYDYECEKEGLSTASDLQQAIDGNRREGRRNASTGSANYPQVGYSVAATAAAAAAHHNSTALLNKHLNGTLNLRNGLDDDAGLGPASQQAALVAAYHVEQLAVLEAQQRQFERAQRKFLGSINGN